MKLATLFLALASTLIVNAEGTPTGFSCRADNRMTGGSLRELNLLSAENVFFLQSQFVESLRDPKIKIEDLARDLSCRIEEKPTLAFCQNSNGVIKVQIKDRKESSLDSLIPDEKKKIIKYTDITVYENDKVLTSESYLSNQCEIF